jgi:hypothetical protein
MAIDPDHRYASVKEFAADIETVLDGRTPTADKANLVKQAARFAMAHDPGIARMRVVELDFWAIAAVLVGAGIGLFASRWVAGFWWAAIGAGFAAAVFPTLRWLRLRRKNDAPPSTRVSGQL